MHGKVFYRYFLFWLLNINNQTVSKNMCVSTDLHDVIVIIIVQQDHWYALAKLIQIY